jgi:cobyrinic acid a,c-diamide synthase
LVEGWRALGVEVSFFSPLANETPTPMADAIYLPGGYPELHAGRLAAATKFLSGLRAAAKRGAFVFGECGGYMVLGEGLVDSDGGRHAMSGLLPLETSFAERKLHIGYRRARLATQTPLGIVGAGYRGHEFHYAGILREADGEPLFDCANAAGEGLGPKGLVRGTVAGSFIHLIDHDPETF